jgi:hypothetical protein
MAGVVAENFAGSGTRPLVKVIGDDGSPPFFINLRDDPEAQNISIAEAG